MPATTEHNPLSEGQCTTSETVYQCYVPLTMPSLDDPVLLDGH